MLRKISSFIVVISILCGSIPSSVFASDTGYFVVTAYYSPLPNQQYYITWDYEKEKILNGQWIAGASGRKVFSGMLAAPGKYSFGTKIYLEGLGVGEVTDRGGAIVPAGKRWYEHDRIDVWMGHGEEGLRRAMYWGKRKIKWSVIAPSRGVTLNYHTIPSPLWATNSLKKNTWVFYTPLGKWSAQSWVKKLQELFLETGHYSWAIDGVYNSEIIDIVYNFQIENGLMQNENSYGAGYWGARTRSAFSKKYKNWEFVRELTVEEKMKQNLRVFNQALGGEKDIQTLQEILIELSLYDGKITQDYNSIEGSILEYQVENDIVSGVDDLGAGVFGPKTRKSLKETYQAYIEAEVEKQELTALLEEFTQESELQAQEKLLEIGESSYGEISPRVRELQVTLRELGYFDHKDTAIFGVKTKNSIIALQIDTGLLQTTSDIWAGILGPKTRQAFEEKLADSILTQKLKEAEVFEKIQELNIWVEEKQEEEKDNDDETRDKETEQSISISSPNILRA